ncbi:MAG TPA: hypothetical protein VJT31_39665 [Rugosimonospora sp.]|nr:hypothetical protein [Rugosimonospora sp.]
MVGAPVKRARRERDGWRGGEDDETGRCQVAEDRTRIRSVHEPAVTRAQYDFALAAAPCGKTADGHSLDECPDRQLYLVSEGR